MDQTFLLKFKDFLPHILVQTQHDQRSDQTDSREKEFLHREGSSWIQKHITEAVWQTVILSY